MILQEMMKLGATQDKKLPYAAELSASVDFEAAPLVFSTNF